MKALVGTFNQEKALVGTFFVIVKLQTSQRFVSSSTNTMLAAGGGWVVCSCYLRHCHHLSAVTPAPVPRHAAWRQFPSSPRTPYTTLQQIFLTTSLKYFLFESFIQTATSAQGTSAQVCPFLPVHIIQLLQMDIAKFKID